MTCKTHIVECLRAIEIEPFAFASSEYSDNNKASLGIDYEETQFCTKYENLPQWWAVDFKRIVSVNSYQIHAEPINNWISGWTLSISFDNKTWIFADAPAYQYPGDTIFKLNKTMNARFIRINGGCPLSPSKYPDKTHLALYYIKFFGSLSPIPSNRLLTCRCQNNYLRFMIFWVICIVS